jgi:uncharacterized protein YciI
MKFLIIGKTRQILVEMWAKLLPAHFKYLDDLERKKVIEVSYHLIGHQGDVLIVNANSDEELASIIGERPIVLLHGQGSLPADHTRGSQAKAGTNPRKATHALRHV